MQYWEICLQDFCEIFETFQVNCLLHEPIFKFLAVANYNPDIFTTKRAFRLNISFSPEVKNFVKINF